ncbi:MAG: hypothetical protein ACE5I3_15865 [Phycisphaerae bacterium]
MRRVAVMCLATLLMAEVAVGQRKPTVPMAAVSEGKKLAGEKKIRYLLRQLDLTPEQQEYARGLIATILDEKASPPLSLEQVYTLMAEQQQAEKDGDKERAEQVREQLRQLGRGANRESEFFMNMEPELTDKQKALLRAAGERLKRNPSGTLRPVDVFRVVRQLDLTKEQHARFAEFHQRLRADQRKVRTLDDEQRFQLMNELLERIRAELTPQQQARFDIGIRRLRPDLASRLGVRVPQTQPATEGESGKPGRE